MANIRNPFSHAYTKDNFISAATVTCPVGQFTELGRVVIPAGVAVALGFGELEGQDASRGRFFLDMRDSSAAPGVVSQGLVRFDLHSPQDFVERTIYQERTENLRTSATDRTQQAPMPIIPDVVGEDWAIVFKYRPDAAVTVGRVNTLMVVSATQFETR